MLEAKRGLALKNRLVGDAELYKGLLNRESLRAADGVKCFRGTLTSLHQRSSECVPLEILSTHWREKRTRRDGQVDRKICIALETLEGFLDGHVADVYHERRAKTKQVSCRRDSRER